MCMIKTMPLLFSISCSNYTGNCININEYFTKSLSHLTLTEKCMQLTRKAYYRVGSFWFNILGFSEKNDNNLTKTNKSNFKHYIEHLQRIKM